MMSPDRILVLCVSLAVGVTVYMNLRPSAQPVQQGADPALAARIEAEKTQARIASDAERSQRTAAERERQARRQADLFNQRYNTDRTPVGSVGGPDPSPAPTPKPAQGFSVVTPAVPPGHTGGFREVTWTKK